MAGVAAELRVGVDVGSRRHSVAIGDVGGAILDEFEIRHDSRGFEEFFARVERCRATPTIPVSVAMEGYNGWARPLDRLVQARGYRLYNVNNLKLARFKGIFPAPGKTDRIDARKELELFQLEATLPIARGVLQEVPPPVHGNEQLKRLMCRRRALVDEKVRVLDRLQSDLQAVCPGLLELAGDVDTLRFLHFITARDELTKLARMRLASLMALRAVGRTYAERIQTWQHNACFGTDVGYVGPMIIADARRILELRTQIHALEATCDALSARSTPARLIISIPGFGRITSATLAGEIGSTARFASEASLALYLGMAAFDSGSGLHHGARPPRQINRHAKAAMMAAVDRHRKQVPESRRYYEKKRAEGKTHNQAIRALGRHLTRVFFQILKHERPYIARPTQPVTMPARGRRQPGCDSRRRHTDTCAAAAVERGASP